MSRIGNAKWLTIADIAKLVGVSLWTARRLIKRGSIPGGRLMYAFDGRVGEKWLVNAAEFFRWLRRAPDAPNAPDAPVALKKTAAK